jgi:hypothetical protein
MQSSINQCQAGSDIEITTNLSAVGSGPKWAPKEVISGILLNGWQEMMTCKWKGTIDSQSSHGYVTSLPPHFPVEIGFWFRLATSVPFRTSLVVCALLFGRVAMAIKVLYFVNSISSQSLEYDCVKETWSPAQARTRVDAVPPSVTFRPC